MKLVSAILTTCRREPETVARALKSMTGQTYPNMEIIVVDDSPADYPRRGEVELLARRAGEDTGRPVVYIPHGKNSGACAARNTGLKAAKGEFVAFLDDDDEWLPEKTARMLPLLENGAVLAYCASIEVNDDTGKEFARKHELHRGRVYDAHIKNNFIGSTSFPVIRRDALISIGGFDTEMRSAQDYDVWLRLAETGGFECTGECLTRYHVHSGERISANVDKRIAGLERLNLKNADYLEAHPDAAWIRGMKLVPLYRAKGESKKALCVWRGCARKKPFNILGNIKYLVKALAAR
ncbi:MAG: glycosyltransferase family 2 protein [Clostridia bacterium]|nr:glycosyltransferase family 2 protein [Clostridia bacterium]